MKFKFCLFFFLILQVQFLINSQDIWKSAYSGNLDQVIKFIEKVGVEVDTKDSLGMTPLHHAMKGGQFEVGKYLIEKEANIYLADNNGRTVIFWAITSKSYNCIKYLIEDCKLDIKKPAYLRQKDVSLFETALSYYCDSKTLKLIYEKDKNIKIPDYKQNLELYVSLGDLDKVKSFIKKGESPSDKIIENCIISDNVDILTYFNDLDLIKKDSLNDYFMIAVKNNSLQCAKYFIDRGSDINYKKTITFKRGGYDIFGGYEDGPIVEASRLGFYDIIQLLVEKGANVDDKSEQNAAPCILIAAGKGHVKVVEYLISKGADVNSKNATNDTPLMMASYNGYKDMVEFLLLKGANPDLKNNDKKDAKFYAESNGYKEIVEVIDKNRIERFVRVAEDGNIDLLKAELLSGLSIDSINSEGKTALIASSEKNLKKIVDYLLKKGANVNIKDNSGQSALYIAVINGNKDIVTLLIKANADINVINKDDKSLLDLATEKGYKDIIKLLNKAGLK